ncbi:hypothetical protein [Halobaculum sp. EA56]|uniref:hypothetical protein n=1 Tax=Halobaculum sp. EA56 TaxID=3421648 RepID=UPI003EB7B4B9
MSGLIELITTAFTRVLDWLTGGFRSGLETGYDALSASLFGTPTPVTNGVFVLGRPTNEPWASIHDALIVGEVTLFALLLLIVCVQARHAVAAAGFTSSSSVSRTRRSAWIGAALVVTWYWVAATALHLIDGVTLALLPRLDTFLDALVLHLGVTVANPLLGFSLAAVGGAAMWLLQAMFIVRRILLPIAVYAMPIGIAIAYGGIPLVSEVASGFLLRFVPLVLAPVPAALVLRGYELIVTTGAFGMDNPFPRMLLVVSLPVVLVIVTWQVFRYSNPVATRAAGTAIKGAAIVGAAGTAAAVASPAVGLTAARFGPKAAAGHAVFDRVIGNGARSSDSSYRRTENDPVEAPK